MTTRILLQKGCLLKAQLQTHGLDVKLDSFDMRKVGEEWKLLIPNLVVDVVQECNGLFTCQNLLIQKSMTNPLAGKFRLEILAEASSFGPGERCTREPSGAPARLLVNVENGKRKRS